MTAKIKTVGVKELKDTLSACLREVKTGTIFLVTDRGTVIAELKQTRYSGENNVLSSLEQEWIDEGILLPRKLSKVPCQISPVTLPSGSAQKVLDEERAE